MSRERERRGYGENRTCILPQVRCTEDELKELEAEWRRRGFRSAAEYIRYKLFVAEEEPEPEEEPDDWSF